MEKVNRRLYILCLPKAKHIKLFSISMGVKMYKCDDIKKITIIYSSSGPGSYAGEKFKIIQSESARAICREANRLGISIEKLFKEREDVESVVINRDVSVIPQKTAHPPEKKSNAEEEKPSPAPS